MDHISCQEQISSLSWELQNSRFKYVQDVDLFIGMLPMEGLKKSKNQKISQ